MQAADAPESKIAAAARAGKMRRNAAGFDALLTKSPDLADQASAWRQENPAGGPNEFLEHLDRLHEQGAMASVQDRPEVQEAQAQAAQAGEKAAAAQQVAAGTADPTQAPSGGLTVKEAQQVAANGAKAIDDKAKAAEEHVRTVEQTIVKESKKDAPSKVLAQEVKKAETDLAGVLQDTKQAMASGALPFSEDVFREHAVAAGLSPERIETQLTTLREQIKQKQESKAESGTSEVPPAPGDNSQTSDGSPALPPLSVLGKSVKAATGAGNTHEYTLAVVPLQSVISSEQKGYPAEIQPRDTNRTASAMTVQKIGAKLNPALLMDSPTVTDGAPVVGPDMVVEGGNHRIMGIRSAAAAGTLGGYKQELLTRAQEYGLDADQISKIKDPVLVRVRKTEISDRAAFARELNVATTNAMDPSARSKSDAAGFTPEHLEMLSTTDVLSAPANRPFVGRFISSVVPETERGALWGVDREANAQAIRRIQEALFYSAYGDGSKSFEVVQRNAIEDSSPEGKNVVQALQAAAPAMAKLRALIGTGARTDLMIASELMEAVAAMAAIRNAGMSVGDFLAQQGMFEPMSPLASRILEDLDGAKRSEKKLRTYLIEYAERAMATADPNQFTMFGNEVPNKEELWSNATEEVKHVAKNGIPGEVEPDLFGNQAEGDGSSPADVPPQAPEDRGGPGAQAGQPDVGFGSSNKVFTAEGFAAARDKLRQKFDESRRTMSANPMFDPEYFTLGAQMMGYFVEGGIRSFSAVSKRVAHELGATVADLKAFLPAWYNGLRDLMTGMGMSTEGMDDGGTVSREMAKMASAEPVATEIRSGDTPPLLEAVLSRPLPSDNKQLKKTLTEIDGQVPDPLRMKEGQEALEVVIATQARAIVRDMAGSDPGSIFTTLVNLYKSQPNLDIRTSTSMENQAYSTPVPLGYLAGLLAGADQGGMVYEPTAGNGMLLLVGEPSSWVANELDAARFRNLSSQNIGKVRNGDALTAFDDKFVEPRTMGAVVANPPFGKMAEPREYDGVLFGKLDHLIAAMSLRALKDNGRASLIIAATKDGAPSLEDRRFYSWLASRYNVVGNFEVAGDLYSRQGASWPVRVLTINGRTKERKSGARLFNAPRFDSWEGVFGHASTILGSGEWRAVVPADGKPGGASDLPFGNAVVAQGGGTAPGGPVRGSDRGKQASGRQPGGDRGAAPGGPGGSPEAVGGSPVADVAVGSPAPVGGLEEQPTGGVDAGPGGDGGQLVAPDGARSAVGSVAKDHESLVQPYVPGTFSTEMDAGLFVPTGLMEPMQEGLQRLRAAVGDLATFVAKELQLTEDEVKDGRFMGAQVESIAAAIWNIKENSRGTIIADDTGVGKGRQAAALIRWGIVNGKTPVFITLKPNLFSDMYSDDLENVSPGSAKPQVVNAGEAIMAKDEDGKTYAAINNGSKKRLQEIVDTGALLPDTNCLFCTYSQLNQNNLQQRVIETLAKNGILILDEAHTAAGEDSNTGKFFRDVIGQFQGVVYLSATWAKRASNMVVYNATSIGDVGMDNDALLDAITSGGLALQGQISQALARFGQFFRRERSFEGVEYNTVQLPDPGLAHARISDDVTLRLRTILEVDREFSDYIEAMADSILEANGGFDVTTGKYSARVTHTDFANIVHNAVRQLGLAIKADEAADMAIESIRRGEAVVVGVDNTMGALLEECTRINELKVGDACPGLSWKAVLRRYLDRTRTYKISKSADLDEEEGVAAPTKKKRSKDIKLTFSVPVDQMPSSLRNAYNEAYDLIDSMDDTLPASPIDWIRKRIEDAGFNTAEITARSNSIDYSGLIPKIGTVPQSKKARYQTVQDFNSGKIHAMVMNVAGATGLSAHADKRWTDANNPRRRHMIVAQPALDINMFKQLLGRVHRTGQIIPPRYSILALSLPSEIRPIASLQKKVKSLNSSTSASTRSNMDVQGDLDMLNQYGDMVVQSYLNENPMLAKTLGLSVDDNDKPAGFVPGISSKATGRLALLPVKDQIKFYDDVGPRYMAYIDFLTRTGQNKLVKRVMDLQAKEVKKETIFPGTGTEGPFSSPSYLITYSVKSDMKLPTPDQVQSEIDVYLNGKAPAEHRLAILEQAAEAWTSFVESASAEALEKAGNHKRITTQSLPKLGEAVSMKIMGDEIQGVVTRVRWTGGKKAGNPYIASKWEVRMATNGIFGTLDMALSQYISDATPSLLPMDAIFNPETNLARGQSSVIVGNLLGAYTQLKGKHGEIVDFTSDDGQVLTGMLMPKSFDRKTDLKTSVEILDGKMAAQTLKAIRPTVNPQMLSQFGITAILTSDGKFRFETLDKSRKAILQATKLLGVEFANGRATVGEEQAVKALTAGRFSAEKTAMEDAGLMEGQALKPEAFADPFKNELFETLNEHTVRMASQIIRMAGGDDWTSQAVSAYSRLKDSNVKLATIVRRVESITSRMQDGTVQPKELRAFIREISDRMGKSSAPVDSGSARNQAEVIQNLAQSAKFIGEVIAKAAMYKRMEGRRIPVSIEHVDFYRLVAPAVAPLVPFFSQREMKMATEHFVWCYNEQHPEDPLDFTRPGEAKKFAEYLTGTKKVHSNKWVGGAAVAMGLFGMLGPELPGMVFHMASAGALMFAGYKLATFAIEKIVKMAKSPKGRFYSMGPDWRALSDNIEQALFRTQEVAAPALKALREIDDIVRKAAMKEKSLARRGMEFLFPSKDSNDRYEALAEMLADRHDLLTDLPPELKPAEEHLRKILPYFARMMKEAKISTQDDYFPKIYRHEGLQALKEDPEALSALADHLVPQILENSPEKIDSWQVEFPQASRRQIAFNLALHALNAIYDGSEEMAFGVARRRDDEAHDFAIRVATRNGEMNRIIYRKIRQSMESTFRTYQTGRLMKRKIEFDLPKEWQLSDGTKAPLVDRNYVRVMKSYINQVSRSMAQKDVFDSDLATKLLNSLGGKDSDQRREVDQLMRQSLNNYLRPIESEDRLVIRAFYSAWNKINSAMFLGLNVASPLKNVLFSEFKASVLSDLRSWERAGRVVAMQMMPGLRNLPSQVMLREQAEEVGAVFRLVSPGFSGQRNIFNAVMALNARSWEAVDVASFFLGRVMAPKILAKAAKGSAYDLDLLREMFGADRLSEVLAGGPTGLSEDDLNRAGLLYRNLISGYGMTHFRPQFMGSEHGKFWTQFLHFVAEDSKFINDRVFHGPRQNWLRFGRGLALAGVLGMMLNGAMNAATGGSRPDGSTKEPDLFVYQVMQASGGMANFETIAKAFMRQDPAERIHPFDAFQELATLPMKQVSGTIENIGLAAQNAYLMKDAQVPLDERPGVLFAPFFRSAARLPLPRLLGVEVPKTDGELRIEDFRREAREAKE